MAAGQKRIHKMPNVKTFTKRLESYGVAATPRTRRGRGLILRRAVDSSPRRSRRRKREKRAKAEAEAARADPKAVRDNIYNEAELGSGPGKVAAPKAKRKGSGREQRVKSE